LVTEDVNDDDGLQEPQEENGETGGEAVEQVEEIDAAAGAHVQPAAVADDGRDDGDEGLVATEPRELVVERRQQRFHHRELHGQHMAGEKI
jgi:hypothetical protein